MAAKVQWYRNAWWVMTHARGKRWRKRLGPTKAHKRDAEEIARKINGALALGTFEPKSKGEEPEPLLTEAALRRWHETYSPTFKPSFEIESRRIIDNYLAPFFGCKELREIREEDLLLYIREKLNALAPVTIQTHLSILRRVRGE